MIHFFRRIRQKLITGNRFSKYMLYAIGEIALVMIGILLALQVNNWNESRKERASELILLNNLYEEFKTNHNEFKKIYQFKQDTKIKWDDFLVKVSNPNATLEDKTLNRPTNGALEFNSSNSVLNSILTSGTLDIISNDSLKHYLSSWNDHLNAYREIERRHVNLVENSLRQYEIKHRIIKEYKGLQFSFDNPFYKYSTEEEHTKRKLQVNEDPEYQNLLMLNYMWINLINLRSETLNQEFGEITKILGEEINTTTK